MTFEEFICREASLPGYPGPCMRMTDNWLIERTGKSALATFGREYATEADAAEWLKEPGGLAVAFNRVMRACGFKRTTEPCVGDVGLVFHNGLLAVAIRGSNGWLSRDDGGLFCVAGCWKAWRVE